MKLRNKKTGEIIDIYSGEIILHYNHDRKTIHFKRLEDLEDWEDYEEPKGYWSYDTFDNDVTFNSIVNEDDRKADQEIGNYFDTREEAKKAVEKLKAWKRLKDSGFVFCGKGDCLDTIKFDYGSTGYNNQDFNLLFGGEE